MLWTPSTPNIITTRKRCDDSLSRQRILKRVAKDAAFNTRLLPVIVRDKIIGWVGAERFPSTRVWTFEHQPWMDAHIDRFGRLFGWTSIDGIIKSVTVDGKIFPNVYAKSYGTAATGQTWSHLWAVRGNPAPGDFNGTAYTARTRSDAEIGAFSHAGNVSPSTKHLLSAYVRNDGTADATTWMLYDMVLTYDNCAFVNASQNFTNGVSAARYCATGEPGLQIMSAETDACGVVSYVTISYTNNLGNASAVSVPGNYATTNIAAPTDATPWPSAFAGSIGGGVIRSVLQVNLTEPDLGARSLTDFQQDNVGGELAFILGYQLAYMPAPIGDAWVPFDMVKGPPSLPRIYDGAALTFAVFANGSSHSSYVNWSHFAWS